jgi:hypothetical protein
VAAKKEAMAQLRAALRGDPPAGLEALDEQILVTLAAAIREAEEQQRSELVAAGDRALRYVPALLRGPVRKALFG